MSLIFLYVLFSLTGRKIQLTAAQLQDLAASWQHKPRRLEPQQQQLESEQLPGFPTHTENKVKYCT